jgi:hypothetical protein
MIERTTIDFRGINDDLTKGIGMNASFLRLEVLYIGMNQWLYGELNSPFSGSSTGNYTDQIHV